MKKDVYAMVTEKITGLLEKGVIPWRMPWKTGSSNNNGAVNWHTGRPYNGINQMLLGWEGEWATFKQIGAAGGKVKKGEKSSTVVFFMTYEKEDDEGELKKWPVLREYKVFEINSQCEGLTTKRIQSEEVNEIVIDPIEEAEEIVKGFMNAPDISYKSGRAVYNSFHDSVSVPPMKDYQKAEEFYCTLFHELMHSTGHKNRLDRKFGNKFGDVAYSKEELVAEIGAAMLCGKAGIEHVTIENSAAYINGWLKALKNDTKLIVGAASQAQKGAEYIIGDESKQVEINKTA